MAPLQKGIIHTVRQMHISR